MSTTAAPSFNDTRARCRQAVQDYRAQQEPSTREIVRFCDLDPDKPDQIKGLLDRLNTRFFLRQQQEQTRDYTALRVLVQRHGYELVHRWLGQIARLQGEAL